jgi:hypothetical protein
MTCRLDALNAYFAHLARVGGPKIPRMTGSDFERAIQQYDRYLRVRFNVTTSAAAFDLVNSDQTNLVSWVLRCHRIHTRYYALGAQPDTTGADFIFIYNSGHIWGTPHKGPRPATRNEGVIVPVRDLIQEWRRTMQQVRTLAAREQIHDAPTAVAWIRRLHAKKQILGDLEVPVGVAFSILETARRRPPDPRFGAINELVVRYARFIQQLTRGRYLDLPLLEQFAPILAELLGL